MTESSTSSTNHLLIGKAEIITQAFHQIDLEPLRQQLLQRIERDPDDAEAMLDLSTLLLVCGQRELGLTMQRHAVQARSIYRMPARRQPPALRLLALVACGDFMANTPLEFLIADSDIELIVLYLGEGVSTPATLPEHDAVIVAVGESSDNAALLRGLEAPLSSSPVPVINRPEHVLKTSRDGLHAALRGVPGVVSPAIARIARARLAALAQGAATLADVLPGTAFPLLVRPLDSNAGHGLGKIDEAAGLASYLEEQAGEEAFFVSQFVDYRGADGLYRKYRVVLIDGRAYLGHLGISPRWMVHYLNADMEANAANRAEEARAMQSFDQEFGARHAVALRAFYERVGLEYLVIDCAETPDGALLVFEADTCGIIHAMDPQDLYPYKPPQMRRIFAAFQGMVMEKAGVGQRQVRV